MIDRSRQAQQQQRVYFAVSGRKVKIGLAVSPARRVAVMRCARADIRLLGSIPGGREVERNLQQRFGANRIAGEWFRFTTELESVINEILAKGNAVPSFLEDHVQTTAMSNG
jgi:hypothetical protein